MSYVDALYVKDNDLIKVIERVNGKRKFVEYPAEYTFYSSDPRGKHKTVKGLPVRKFSTGSHNEFLKEKAINSRKKLYESDFQPIARCLEKYYLGMNAPNLQTAFFDIETDFDEVKGYAPTDNPFNRVTAVSMYLDWTDQLICLVLPPKGMSLKTAQEIVDQFENTFLYTSESDMLIDFLDLIHDADILSGWNSEGFDIPYLVNRITKILSKTATRKFCLWNKFPKKRTFERYGAESVTYDLVGRVHLDYMQLYQKYTYHEMHSYALDAIGEYELNERKVEYKGTLDDLYNKDFKKFVKYSLQDAALLHKLDTKLKFISLASEVAHANTVLIPKTMGAVAVTEQGIINEAHERGFVVPDKVRISEDDNTQAAGAYVAYPKQGLHNWIGSVDIKSLYPSAIRALNMGPETVIGQLRPVLTDEHVHSMMADKPNDKGKMVKGSSFAEAWEGMFGSIEYTAVMDMREDVNLIIDWEPGASGPTGTFSQLSESSEVTAKDVYDIIFEGNYNWVMSANGTIFSLDVEGVIPGLLARWYSERKVLQGNLEEAIKADDKEMIEFYDKRQLVKKIGLNSLYGAILNPHCRFFDKRIGQSTTLTGRGIARHMDAHVNECLTGVYDHIGDAILYGDTDSAYFSAWPMIKDEVEAGEMQWDTDTAIALYDNLADDVNDSFPAFMERAYRCPRKYGELISCCREVVGSTGLFITKKRYAIMVVDNEGKRCDTDGKPGKIKAMGLDLKRSDTPPVVQNFLKDILDSTLNNIGRDKVIEQILEFKDEFNNLQSWEKGAPKRVNNLTKYTAAEVHSLLTDNKPARLPGHVRAGMNFNNLRKMNNDKQTTEITDGMKAIVCKLKDNPLGITSIARPTDETNIPKWFTDLPFDDEAMAKAQIDKKVDNLLGVLDWDLEMSTDISNTFLSMFEF